MSDKEEHNVLRPFAPMGRWQIVQAKQQLAKDRVKSDDQAMPSSTTKPVKRKQPTETGAKSHKKRKLPIIAPVGLKWDQVNYSCAYKHYSSACITYGTVTARYGQTDLPPLRSTSTSWGRGLSLTP
jgi:hypothetical protein